jgi:hypothetical protein
MIVLGIESHQELEAPGKQRGAAVKYGTHRIR